MHCPPADSSAAGFVLGIPESGMDVETLRSARRTPSKVGKRHYAPKIEALPGRLYAERKRCNRRNCRCAAGGDALHGPYLYRRWSENGRLRRQYVKPADADQVRARLTEWRRLHPPARTLRDQLREIRQILMRLTAVPLA
jgi:hypothetical protein